MPGERRVGKNDWANLDLLSPHDEVKFVIADRADYEFARDVIARHALAARVRRDSVLAGARRPDRAGARGVDPRRPLPVRLQLQAAQVHLERGARGV